MSELPPINIKWGTSKTVQKGAELRNIKAVKERLKEIRDSPKSVYHKALLDGHLQIHYDPGRARRGRYDIVWYTPLTPHGSSVCSNCEMSYFSIEEDYLCPDCRAGLGKEEA